MTSSRVAVLIVPCTGGHSRNVSRTTASKNGKAPTASELVNSDGGIEPKDEKDVVDAVSSESAGDDSLDESEHGELERDSNSSLSLVWTSGFRERRWIQYEMDSAVESEPANRKVDNWSRSSASVRRLRGSSERLYLTIM